MKYKSILLDVDGTLVPVGPHTVPSERVAESLRRAKDLVHVSIVSGRSIKWLTDIFQSLDLTAPCIINGGSQIIDPKTLEIIWEPPLSLNAVREITNYARRDGFAFMINDNGVEYKNPNHNEYSKPLAIQLSFFSSKADSDRYMNILRYIPSIAAHKFFSWDRNREYKMEVYITDKEATKSHAAKELVKMLQIDTSDLIGVGDSRNDVPLLNVCGLKVAMGNADEKLKSIAHYIAPSVEEDGVAHVGEKFILS